MHELETHVIFGSEARKRLFVGIEIAAKTVACTLGPKGKCVLIQVEGEPPHVTKDGIRVAKSINLRDPVEKMGAALIKEAASHTNDVSGDGTTTATVLTHAMVKEGLKLLEAGYPATELCRGIEQASKGILEDLKASAKQLTTSEEVAQVATISANGDAKIGALIAQAMEKVGRDGIITVEDAKGMETSLEVVEGMQFDRGYLSPYFVNNPDRMNTSYQDALVLVTDKKLSSLRDLVPLLEAVMREQKPLLIIAEDVDGEALQGLVLNRVKANLPVVAIKAPGYGSHRDELLADICVMTGATLLNAANGISLDKATVEMLGRTKKIVVDSKSTTLVGTGLTKDAVDHHVSNLTVQLEDVTLSPGDVTKLKTRIAKLAAGVAVVRVGGATEVEMIERKYRIEDALNATRAATEEGIVPGGGMALFFASRGKVSSDASEAIRMGASIVYKASLAPLRQIASNSGVSPDIVVARLEELLKSTPSNRGYNAATDTYEDLVSTGVIDPVKVTRSAMEHAASVAVTFLSLDAVVVTELSADKK